MPPLLPLLLFSLVALAAPSPAAAARAWQPPVQLSGSADTLAAAGDVTPSGTVVAAWIERSGQNGRLLARAGDAAAVELDADASAPAVATAGDGTSVIAWSSDPADGGLPRTMAVLHRPASGFGTPVDLGASGWGRPIAVAGNARGDLVIAFIREIDYAARVHTVLRPAGGEIGTPVAVAQSGSAGSLDVALSDAGEAVFVWNSPVAEDAGEVHAASRLAAAPPTSPVRLAAADTRGRWPRVAVDAAGRAVAVWVQGPGSDSRIHGAMRPAGGAWTPATGLDARTHTGPDVAADADGDVVLTWAHYTPYGEDSGQLGPLRVARGRLDTGGFAAGANVYPLRTPWSGPMIDMAPDGSAVIAWDDFHGGTAATRRQGTGDFEAPQAVGCPEAARAGVAAVALDGNGRASALLRRIDIAPAVRPLWLAQDAAADTPGPEACPAPPRKPYPIYSPVAPAPGQQVTIDVEGTRDPDGVSTTWQWDMDDDGTFERASGTDFLHRHTWATAGMHDWQLTATTEFGQGGSGTAIWTFTAFVSTPFEPPAPVTPGPPAQPPAPAGPAATVVVGPRLRLKSVLRRGLPVVVAARESGAAELELWITAKEARRLRLARKPQRLGRAKVTLSAGAPVRAHVRLRPTTARKLRSARRLTAGLAVTRAGVPLTVIPVTVRR